MRAVSLKGKPSRSVASVRRSYVRTAWPEQHKTLRVFAGHKVQRSEEGWEKPHPQMCPEHDEPSCFNCNCLICRDCVLYDHREHKSDFVKKCTTESRKSLHESLTPL